MLEMCTDLGARRGKGRVGMVAGQKGVATLTTCHIPVGAHFVLQHFYAFRSANISHSRTQWRGNGSGLKAKGPWQPQPGHGDKDNDADKDGNDNGDAADANTECIAQWPKLTLG